jgi:hypothetical protein
MAARISFLSLMLISLFSSTGHVSAIGPGHTALAAFDAQHVRFVEMVSGLNQPLLITNASDGSGFVHYWRFKNLIIKWGPVADSFLHSIHCQFNRE